MPKLLCPCGYVHDLTPIPDAGYVTVKDVDYEPLLNAEAARAKLGVALRSDPENGAIYEELGQYDRVVFQSHRRLYECPRCGRLMWQSDDGRYHVYVPEEFPEQES